MLSRSSSRIEIEAPFPITVSYLTAAVNADENLVDDVSLTIQPGEVVAFRGENGSGKSTLLNLMAGRGFFGGEPTGGSVSYGEISIYDDLNPEQRVALRKKYVAFLGQNFKHGLLPEANVEENLRFVHNLAKNKIDEDILADAVAYYGIGKLMKRQVKHLSGGQQQLLPIISAELNDPFAFMLDEPTAALDIEKAAMVDTRLENLAGQFGKTIIMVSHQARPRAQRIITFRQGAVLADEGPDLLQPAGAERIVT